MCVRVLLVDDMPEMLEVLSLIFEQHSGVKVVGQAKNNDKAIRTLEHTLVDMISIDIYMGDYNGFDLCRTVRRTMPHLFITMCSSEPTPENKKLAVSCGAHYFLSKPVGLDDVAHLVNFYKEWKQTSYTSALSIRQAT